MECRELKELLSAYADGQASSEEQVLLLAHLEGCPACRRELKLFQTMKTALRRVCSPAVPADLRAALLAQAARRRSKPTPWLKRAPVGVGFSLAFAAAVLAIGVEQFESRQADSISVDAMLAAHNEYALTMPLCPQELVLSDLSMRLR
ncbi:MAG: hypothetical protein A3J74_06335 [Elusimicrobia bacterium RIFCSPHIGHO2_02_FULL_57_9]|nr:MAG: hypothetical protein A3J74_06335 [Elusimicrobia bacterium RIFCSPHIGHO2_02_FULL_57_9]